MSQHDPANRDLTGRVFGELTVLRKLPTKRPRNHHTVYECECSCGKIVDATSADLLQGHKRSCGHLFISAATGKLRKIHAANATGKGSGTQCANLISTAPYSSGSSGYRGVSWSKSAHAYTAQITFRHHKYHLGVFADPAEAHKAYLDAKEKLHTQHLIDFGYRKK